MLDKIKASWQTISGILIALLTLGFLFEKSKRESAEAIADNKEDLDKINAIEKQIAGNDGKLEAEESKRSDIKKAAEDAKHDNSDDPSDFLNKR